jgi:FkbM family methyltransferase
MNNKISEIIEKINQHQMMFSRLELLNKRNELAISLLKSNSNSRSQYMQDLFVLQHTNYKKNGFFVEFGACDGISLSNTYLLETEYGWNGILAEPGKTWWKSIQENRKSIIDHRCVWKESNKVMEFMDADEHMLSTLVELDSDDLHRITRKSHNTYHVTTVSLEDLLDFYDAPKEIDYLSIDTEGSEFEILNSFNFNKYKIKIITVEHNWTENREKIFDLLTINGFNRIHTDLTHCDDWYISY